MSAETDPLAEQRRHAEIAANPGEPANVQSKTEGSEYDNKSLNMTENNTLSDRENLWQSPCGTLKAFQVCLRQFALIEILHNATPVRDFT